MDTDTNEQMTTGIARDKTDSEKLSDATAEIASLRGRVEQMERVLGGLDSFLSKMNPATVEKLLNVVDKYFPHGA